MGRIGRTTVTLALVSALALATAAPVAAVFSVIQTDLTGPDGGTPPRGSATVNQSQLPTPGTLDIRVNQVDVPDGTILDVVITDCLSTPNVGTITVERGRARATITLSSCQAGVGHNSSIFLQLADGTIVLEGGSPWSVRRA